MTNPEMPTPAIRPRRRWLRLSVRALMIMVLVLGIVLGWFVRRAQTQRDAVLALRKIGSSVVYDWEYDSLGKRIPNAKPSGPKWLVERLGDDYFGSVATVGLKGKASDDIMEHVGRLSHLKQFESWNCPITDAGAAHLAGLENLEWVSFANTRITDATVANLRGLNRLKTLILANVPVTDSDLAQIKGLTNLQTLDLSDTKVTGSGFVHLKGMTKLRYLALSKSPVKDLSALADLPTLATLMLDETAIDDDQLAFLARLPALNDLSLRRTAIGDAGLAHLAGMKSPLEVLTLNGTRVTDASLPIFAGLDRLLILNLGETKVTDATLDGLAGLQKLRVIGLDKTAVTDAAIARLKTAIPQLKTAKEAGPRARSYARTARTPTQNPGTKP